MTKEIAEAQLIYGEVLKRRFEEVRGSSISKDGRIFLDDVIYIINMQGRVLERWLKKS